MKLIKLAPVVVAVILSACSSAKQAEPVAEKAQAVNTAPTEKTIAYSCQGKKSIVAHYYFEGENAVKADVTLGKKVTKDLTRDTNNADFAAFASGKYVWHVDSPLALATAEKTNAVNLTLKGKSSDRLLVKDCSVNAAATAKLASK
ncbi:MAG: hypothetical protein Q4A81_08430 [Pasteurellaceae bacterium]|nr:hypothetical protein [Pasteurellaceae bacterium]